MNTNHIITILKKHAIEYHLTDDHRIIAHALLSDGSIEYVDFTGISLKRLLIWLGY